MHIFDYRSIFFGDWYLTRLLVKSDMNAAYGLISLLEKTIQDSNKVRNVFDTYWTLINGLWYVSKLLSFFWLFNFNWLLRKMLSEKDRLVMLSLHVICISSTRDSLSTYLLLYLNSRTKMWKMSLDLIKQLVTQTQGSTSILWMKLVWKDVLQVAENQRLYV